MQEPLGNAVDAALVRRPHRPYGVDHGMRTDRVICRRRGAYRRCRDNYRLAMSATIGLGLAKQVGVDHVLNARPESPEQLAAAILDMTAGEGVDAAWKCRGSQRPMHQAFRAVKNGGRVTLYRVFPTGPVCFDLPNEVIFKGIRVYGITGRRLFRTWYRLAGLFKAGLDIRPVVTHSFPLGDFATGFGLIQSGQCGKVVLFRKNLLMC